MLRGGNENRDDCCSRCGFVIAFVVLAVYCWDVGSRKSKRCITAGGGIVLFFNKFKDCTKSSSLSFSRPYTFINSSYSSSLSLLSNSSLCSPISQGAGGIGRSPPPHDNQIPTSVPPLRYETTGRRQPPRSPPSPRPHTRTGRRTVVAMMIMVAVWRSWLVLLVVGGGDWCAFVGSCW